MSSTVKSGHFEFGNFRLFISGSEPFFDLFLTEYDPRYGYAKYINLHKDARFPFVEFKYPPLEIKEGKEETAEQVIYRAEHNYYESRKGMGQPLWRLHQDKAAKVMEKCEELAG